MFVFGLFVILLGGCDPDGKDSAAEPVGTTDSGTPVDTSQTGDTSQPVDTGETADTDTDPLDFSDIDALITGYLQSTDMPAVGASLVVDGAVVWADGYGWADIDNEIPATGDTAFMLASISKTFVATALMQQVEAGTFELDTPIDGLLDFPLDNPRLKDEVVTVRHLASHTASLCDGWVWGVPGDPDGLYSVGDSDISLQAFLEGYLVEGGEWYADSNYCSWEVGTRYSYSNIGADLAGYLLESSGPLALDDHSDTYIFDALGMENTGWHLADHDVSNVAVPYDFWGGKQLTYDHFGYPDYPSGQLRSSPYDLGRFLAAYANGGTLDGARILEAATVEEILSPQAPDVEPTQGVFWYWSKADDRDVVGHSGGDYGVSTYMFLDPETGVGVVVLLNTYGNADVWTAQADIQRALFAKGEAIAAGMD